MSNEIRCRCPRCTIRGMMGPAVLITVGVLFLLHEMRSGYFDFSNTYPFILIVIGAILAVLAFAAAATIASLPLLQTPTTGTVSYTHLTLPTICSV